MCRGALVGPADVEDDASRWCRTWSRSAKVARGNEAQRLVGPVLGLPVAAAGGAVDADADQLALGLGDVCSRSRRAG